MYGMDHRGYGIENQERMKGRGRMSCFIFIKNAFLASLNWKIYSKLSKFFFLSRLRLMLSRAAADEKIPFST